MGRMHLPGVTATVLTLCGACRLYNLGADAKRVADERLPSTAKWELRDLRARRVCH